MRYLHTMVRVKDIDASLDFYAKQARPQGGPPSRERARPLHADLPRRARRRADRHQRKGAAARTDLQLGYRGLQGRAQFRPPRLRGRQHLRHLPAADGQRRHHQPAAARRPHGFRPVARRHLVRAAAEGQRARAGGALGLDAQHRKLVTGSPLTRSRRRASPARSRCSSCAPCWARRSPCRTSPPASTCQIRSACGDRQPCRRPRCAPRPWRTHAVPRGFPSGSASASTAACRNFGFDRLRERVVVDQCRHSSRDRT